jgi:hypothetical protein
MARYARHGQTLISTEDLKLGRTKSPRSERRSVRPPPFRAEGFAREQAIAQTTSVARGNLCGATFDRHRLRKPYPDEAHTLPVASSKQSKRGRPKGLLRQRSEFFGERPPAGKGAPSHRDKASEVAGARPHLPEVRALRSRTFAAADCICRVPAPTSRPYRPRRVAFVVPLASSRKRTQTMRGRIPAPPGRKAPSTEEESSS